MSKKAIQYGPPLHVPEQYATVAELIMHISSTHPEKGITYIDSSGEEYFESYPQLVEYARSYLLRLHEQGVKPGDIAILEIDQSFEFFRVFWACMLGGIIAAPISPPTSWEPGSTGLLKFTRVWEVLNKPVVIVEGAYRDRYEALREHPSFAGLNLISVEELHGDRAKQADIFWTRSEDIVFLQFSSGSTGIPKGVQLTNHNIIANSISCKTFLGSEEGDNVFTWLPHTHDMGLFGQHLTPILSAANIMVMSPYTFVRSPYLFLRKITEHRGKWFCCTNFGFDWMVQKVPDSKLSTLDLSSLRITLNGAEPISTAVTARFTEKFAVCGYKSNMMFPAYGMAEATVGVCTSRVGSEPRVERIYRSKLVNEGMAIPVVDPDEPDAIEFVHEGYAMTGIQIRIADEEGNTLDERKVGEIQIRGESVTSGYYNLPDVNNDIFVDGWLRTGDLGFMADQSLVVSGRMKDILFIRGQNYFAHDLEEVIYRLEGIPRGNLAVAGHFNSRMQVEELLVFIKYKADYNRFLPIREGVIRLLRTELGLEAAHVLPIKSIPKTTSGKVQRYVLQQGYENGDFARDIKEIGSLLRERQTELPQEPQEDRIRASPEMRQEKPNARTEAELERLIRLSWSEALGLPANGIDRDAPFLSLGGNSIRAYQVLGGLSERLGRELGSELFVFCRTVREMAEYLQDLPKSANCPAGVWRLNNSLNIHHAVAITGLALRLPDASTQEQFWANLLGRKDSIVRVSPSRAKLSGRPEWDDWLGELAHPDRFDHEFFEMTPEEAAFMDPQQRILLEVSYEALEDAGMLAGEDEKRHIGVYVGLNPSTYYSLVAEHIEQNGTQWIHPNAMVGNMSNIAAATISHLYNFTGPALAIDTACSSFLVALHYAASAIRDRQVAGAVVGSANILATPTVHSLSRQAGICSSTKHTKVFDRGADGSVIGEGAVAVMLEPLASAVRENKPIYGIIRGSAVNNDGYSLGIMAPNPQGQYEVLSEACRDANLNPIEVSYVEAHGSGTRIGDPIEVHALTRLFNESGADQSVSVGIGSVKTNIGHLFPASGGASLAKVLLCLKHKRLVPSLHMNELNPALQLDKSPFYIVDEVREWTVPAGHTRKAGISSFGLGGTNAHIVLEEWQETAALHRPKGEQILTFSAKTPGALERLIANTEGYLEQHGQVHAADLCYTRNRYRKHYRYRAACLAAEVGGKTLVFSGWVKGQALRSRPARVGIILGDIWNAAADPLAPGARGSLDGVAEVGAALETADSAAPDMAAKMLRLVYWHAYLSALMQVMPGIVRVQGLRSGASLVPLLDRPTDWPGLMNQCIAGEPWGEEDGQTETMLRADIVLAIGLPPGRLPGEVAEQTAVIDLPFGEEEALGRQIMRTLGQLYVLGAEPDWEAVHPNGTGQIVHLPAYPFEPHAHWIGKGNKEKSGGIV
ncbi:beta-ketoacyl synthase N-terminal-like domain-containing protein [Paenibacillus caui]|uniref:beta-ketoacyl synthase N-terminal-like domain-containing protein n=1 Tax=Paenibacillus caui TaxID=2873927 RepID=UPI001CA81900|nr:beta-ketoacyl synthase N-terminal-like domain-containing protein [Paenibacillus caui]